MRNVFVALVCSAVVLLLMLQIFFCWFRLMMLHDHNLKFIQINTVLWACNAYTENHLCVINLFCECYIFGIGLNSFDA